MLLGTLLFSARCGTPLLCAREDLQAAAAANDEVLPQTYFQKLSYETDDAPVPWDLFGRPQPPVRNAAQDGAFGSAGTAILDCGCGAGDNANFLGARGYEILGFDLSPSAVETAKRRSAEMAETIADASGACEFVEASCTDLAAAARVQERARELGGFPVLLDSALLHCLDDEAQAAYAEGLRPLIRSDGGKLFVGVFSDRNPDPWSNPRRMSEAQLRALFCEERGWKVARVSEAWYERPAARSSSRGGAWTMAWWAVVEPV